MDSFVRDGYIVLSCKNTPQALQETILSMLPSGYRFLDYKYTIQGAALVTYHRDVTSSQSSFNTEKPTYTVIHYDYNGEFLSVSPGSHRCWQLALPTTIKGWRDTVVLFNCDLVHGGLDAPQGVNRKATQYKIVHEKDIPLLQELQGVDVIQEGKQVGYFMKGFLRVFSYLFTVPIETFCRPLLQRRFSSGFSYMLQRLTPLRYFNSHKKL